MLNWVWKQYWHMIYFVKKHVGHLRGFVGSALDHRSLPPELESRRGHIWRVFKLWLRFINFRARSVYLAYHVYKRGRKTSIINRNRYNQYRKNNMSPIAPKDVTAVEYFVLFPTGPPLHPQSARKSEVLNVAPFYTYLYDASWTFKTSYVK